LKGLEDKSYLRSFMEALENLKNEIMKTLSVIANAA
jgi:hypothetical protein